MIAAIPPETRQAMENMRFFKFYPTPSEDTPNIEAYKVRPPSSSRSSPHQMAGDARHGGSWIWSGYDKGGVGGRSSTAGLQLLTLWCIVCSPSTSTGTMARPMKFFDVLAHQPEQAHWRGCTSSCMQEIDERTWARGRMICQALEAETAQPFRMRWGIRSSELLCDSDSRMLQPICLCGVLIQVQVDCARPLQRGATNASSFLP